ncbi:phosphatase PAP2 family protein [Amphibacillus cookii]|uniref:phosphatase PAP2 family protein n=1 Tax=Amphibacillus cookii TaxID=767787 RepID=UPI00195933A2|nr:phosphatase PAP2 family protein [Amphibacillus cookii]MBM7540095.1 undecaprenyl-diphosphatase [Amphibacillus cookii]
MLHSTKIIVISLIIFLYTAIATTILPWRLLDTIGVRITELLNNFSLIYVVSHLSFLGAIEFVLSISIIVVISLIYKKRWDFAILFTVMSIGGVFLNYLLKVLFQRTRPGSERMIQFFNIEFELVSYSFPSGHTMRTTLLFMFIIFLVYHLQANKRLKAGVLSLGITAITGVALSRIILEAHYLTDIVAAISISISWLALCIKIWINKRSKFQIRSMS